MKDALQFKETKEGIKIYFDNNRLMTNNTFGNFKEAGEWLDDLQKLKKDTKDLLKEKAELLKQRYT